MARGDVSSEEGGESGEGENALSFSFSGEEERREEEDEEEEDDEGDEKEEITLLTLPIELLVHIRLPISNGVHQGPILNDTGGTRTVSGRTRTKRWHTQ